MELIGRKSHTKLHPGLEWPIFHIPQDIDDVKMFPTFYGVVCGKTLLSM